MNGLVRHLLLLIAAIACFLVALLGAVGVVHGADVQAWELGGLLALAGAMLP